MRLFFFLLFFFFQFLNRVGGCCATRRSYLYISVLRPYLAACFPPPARPWVENCSSISSWNVLGLVFFCSLYYQRRKKSWRYRVRLTSLAARVSSSLSRLSKTLIVLASDPKIPYWGSHFSDCRRCGRPGVCGGWHEKLSYPRRPTAGGTTPPS